jgi:hypothetical protein
MQKSDPESDPQKLSTFGVGIFSHLTPIGVRENEKIPLASQENLMRKFVRKTKQVVVRKNFSKHASFTKPPLTPFMRVQGTKENRG